MLLRLVILVIGLLHAGLAHARDCDFSSRAVVEAALVSHDDFIAQGRGAVAIGEGKCARLSNVCDKYLPVTRCDAVTYAHPGDNALNPLSIVFNNGSEGCAVVACADTFLSAAMIFEPDERYRPTVELIRNVSPRWQRTEGVDTRFGFNELVSRRLKIETFLKTITAEGGRQRHLVDIGLPWHSSFTRHLVGVDDYVETWRSRDIVVMARDVARCDARCSMKLFLLKFQESDGAPSTLLRLNGYMVKYEHMVLRTAAAAEDSPYNRELRFTLISP